MTEFKYRFVRFGTQFTESAGPRTSPGDDPSALHINELAVDVGGVCWGLDGQALPVLDHHFHRADGQFPSAAAAVIHNAGQIHNRFSSSTKEVWLVAHQQPDFDAFTAMYLARQIIAGEIPADGWEPFGICSTGHRGGPREIDWFKPRTDNLPPDRRWPVLLAACAACVDHCRRMSCPAHRSLHSILYAALLRGRDYRSATSGAVEFFDEVRRALLEPELRLNPLFDSVLEGSQRFAPELAFLDREIAAYQRDVARARKAVVFLQSATAPFSQWYDETAKRPLLAADGKPDPIHLQPPHQRFSEADGIYLRDPECLLFKEWVRNDLENSSMGEGFLFSAIAYSGGRPGAVNSSDYFFSLDPERADGRHLYNVWARLEAAEIEALQSPACAELLTELKSADEAAASATTGPKTTCRIGFAERAAPELQHCFDDPWFDGSNYLCTIIATPNRGTLIDRPGRESDLADDPVVQLVQNELEHSAFVGELEAYDLTPVSRPLSPPLRISISTLGQPDTYRPPPGKFRFASVELRPDIDLLKGQVAEQIGRTLWRFLEPDAGAGVPTDFLERHLFKRAGWVAVWSRRGMIAAFKPELREKIDAFRDLFAELISLTDELQRLVAEAPRAENSERVVEQSERLTRRLVVAKHQLSLPENRILGRFFESSRLDEVLGMLRDVNEAAAERVRTSKSDATLSQIRDLNIASEKSIRESIELQGKVEWLEVFFFAIYVAELIHIVGESLHFNGRLVGFGSLVCSLIAGALAYHVLNPKEHVRLHRLSLWVWLAAFSLLAVFLIIGLRLGEEAPKTTPVTEDGAPVFTTPLKPERP